MKLLINGYGRHGKDTVCEMLGLPFVSSSLVALELVIFPLWGKDRYKTQEECFEDRINHRDRWYEMITAYNTPDRTKLARDILDAHDVYCGMRNAEEVQACNNAGLFDLSIWVDASERLPPEPLSSCSATKEMCDVVIYNNGTLENLKAAVHAFKERYVTQ